MNSLEPYLPVADEAFALSATGIHKSYGAVRALSGADFMVRKGEVRAVVGSNGAGKSTLMKIISGSEQPDAGSLEISGKQVVFANTSESTASGVACVYQEMSLVEGLSVAENIMLGRWRTRNFAGLPIVDMRATHAEAEDALAILGEHIDVGAALVSMSIGQRQIVEIAKALSRNPDVLILDEPTSALAKEDASRLLKLVRRLAAVQGLAVIYISHRMDEIPQVADSVTVMRDGQVVANLDIADASTERIASLMLGDVATELASVNRRPTPDEEVRLSVREITREPSLRGVSFELHRGEVLGIAGLMGSGRTELLRCIFGRDRFDSGRIDVDGKRINTPIERTMIQSGVGLVPEDRRGGGLIAVQSIKNNLTLASLDRFSAYGVMNLGTENRLAKSVSHQLSIRHSGLTQSVSTLSGGNQQKVVFGKWLSANTEILLLDEPTRGIDLHAKAQIYDLIRSWADDGRSIVIVSSELEELFHVCHRIAVMRDGELESPVDINKTTLKAVLQQVMKAKSK